MPHPPRSISAFGRTRTLKEWAAETGLSVKTICSRIDLLGWPPERALSAKANMKFRRGGRHRSDAPRPVPALRRREDGRAFSRWESHGKDHYRVWGEWGSPEAVAAYRRFAAEWSAGAYEHPTAEAGGVSVGAIVIQWREWVRAEYRKEGRRTSEPAVCQAAALKLVELYGDLPAAEFTPQRLRAVRAAWVDAGLSRGTCNAYAFRVKRCFWWAVGQSLVPPAVYHALQAVENLKPGRTAAPDRPKVTDVSDDAVTAAAAQLPATDRGAVIRAMVAVQRLTGMRPQHLCEMRPGDLDRSAAEWVYTPPPAANKTYHLGRSPRFYLGPRVQAVLAPLLDGCPADRRVFGYRLKGPRFYAVTVDGYGKAIRRACRAAGISPWHPHQLRHSLATDVAARTQSIERAAAAIGDTVRTAARVYVHLDPQEQARREIAAEMG